MPAVFIALDKPRRDGEWVYTVVHLSALSRAIDALCPSRAHATAWRTVSGQPISQGFVWAILTVSRWRARMRRSMLTAAQRAAAPAP